MFESLVSMSSHNIIVESFIHYYALYEGVLSSYLNNLNYLWTMTSICRPLKVHNKLNVKKIYVKCLLMYEFSVDMNLFPSFANIN